MYMKSSGPGGFRADAASLPTLGALSAHPQAPLQGLGCRVWGEQGIGCRVLGVYRD